jgi:hypothetical protein
MANLTYCPVTRWTISVNILSARCNCMSQTWIRPSDFERRRSDARRGRYLVVANFIAFLAMMFFWISVAPAPMEVYRCHA